MTVLGSIVGIALALLALVFTAILLFSAWNAVHDELLPGFRVDPPRPRSLGLTLLGVVLPVLLIAALTAYLALWLIGMLIALP